MTRRIIDMVCERSRDVEGHEENEEIVGKIKQIHNYKISLREKHREFEERGNGDLP